MSIHTQMSGPLPADVARAVRQNRIIHKYVIAAAHAVMWVAALFLAAFFHLSPHFSHPQALLASTLVAYSAYVFESILATVKSAAAFSHSHLDFRKAALWGWILLNICINVGWSIAFLAHPSWVWLVLIILTAGCQKYMDGRIPPRLEATQKPYSDNADRHASTSGE